MRRRLSVVFATFVIGCGGAVTDSGVGLDLVGTDAGGHSGSTSAGGAANGGRKGSTTAGATGATSDGGAASGGGGGASAAGAPVTTSDGGATICPIRVSGTYLIEADCYACIQPGAECGFLYPATVPPTVSAPQLTAQDCANLVRGGTGPSSSLWCQWYADDARITDDGAIQTCKSNPGRVVCGTHF